MPDLNKDIPAPEATNPTPPVTPETATPQDDPAQELEVIRAKYERAQKDLDKFRTRQAEVEAAQKEAEAKALAEADAIQKAGLLAAKVAELEKANADAAVRVARAERTAALTGKVSDVDLALAVADAHVTNDGTLDVAALLAAHPALTPDKPTVTPTAGAGGSLATKQAKIASLQEQLKTARSMPERIALERQIHEAQKGQ